MVDFRSASSKNKLQENSELKDLILDGLKFTEKNDRNGRLYYSDSALCHLKGVLNSNHNQVVEKDGLFTFFVESGITCEEVVLDGLNKSSVLLFEDYIAPDIGINIGGRVDGIIYFKDRIYILENKEIGTLPTSPKLQHTSQAMMYSAVLGLPALINYIGRGYSGFPKDLIQREFILDTSYENRYIYLYRAVLASLYNKNKLIPEKPVYMKKTVCKNSYCDWYDLCYNDEVNSYKKVLPNEFKNATKNEIKELDSEATEITEMLLDPVVSRNRTKGVLNHLQKYGYPVSKKILKNQDWERFYV